MFYIRIYLQRCDVVEFLRIGDEFEVDKIMRSHPRLMTIWNEDLDMKLWLEEKSMGSWIALDVILRLYFSISAKASQHRGRIIIDTYNLLGDNTSIGIMRNSVELTKWLRYDERNDNGILKRRSYVLNVRPFLISWNKWVEKQEKRKHKKLQEE